MTNYLEVRLTKALSTFTGCAFASPTAVVQLAMIPTIYPNNWLLDGSNRVSEYRAQFSPTDEVHIANFGAPFRDNWRVLRIKNGVSGDWMGDYASAERALTAS